MRTLGSDALIRSLWFTWPVDSHGPAPDAEAPALPTAEVLASPKRPDPKRRGLEAQSGGARESKDRASWRTSKRI